MLCLSQACFGQDSGEDTLLVFAATSLTDAMNEAAAEFEATSGTKVEVSYGPSRALAQQIARGASPDLYFAAGTAAYGLCWSRAGRSPEDGVA